MSNPDNDRLKNIFFKYQEHTNAQGTSKEVVLEISSGNLFHNSFNPSIVTEEPEVTTGSQRDYYPRLRSSRVNDRSLTHGFTTSPNHDILSSPPRRNSSNSSSELPSNLLEDMMNYRQKMEEYEKYKEAATEVKIKYESYFKEVDPNFRFQNDPLVHIDEFQIQGYENALNKTIYNLQEQLKSTAKVHIQYNKSKSIQHKEDIKTFKYELAEIQSETNRANDSSKDIKNALSTQQPNIEENNSDSCQCFYDLKHTVKDYLVEKGNDGDQPLREIIQDMLTVTKYNSVESDLQKIEELFKNSGRENWINQIRLQVVACYVDRETSAELIDEHISKLNPNIQYGDLDTVYCVRKADQLSKYALAKDHYYGGEYSYDKIDTLYSGFAPADKNKGDHTQPNPMNPKVINIEANKALQSTSGTQPSHPPPQTGPTNTGDVDIVRRLSPPAQFALREWDEHSSFGKQLCKKCSWCKHKSVCKAKICMRCDQLREHKELCQKYSKKKQQLCPLCKDVEHERRNLQGNA